jgi:hypothetical protein
MEAAPRHPIRSISLFRSPAAVGELGIIPSRGCQRLIITTAAARGDVF